MLPLMTVIGDGNEYSLRDVEGQIAAQFELSESERNELLPSGV